MINSKRGIAMKKKGSDQILNIEEAAAHAKIGKMALYMAIKKGRLKAKKVKRRLEIKKSDLDFYRLHKYDIMLKVVNDQRVYDFEAGRYNVDYVSKVLTEMLGRSYRQNCVYYLIRSGQLQAMRSGRNYVICQDALEKYVTAELKAKENAEKNQLRFA